jgi:uncharacterized protein YbaR (Trm112 family)
MPQTILCPVCHGSGTIVALVSAHDDRTEICVCPECKGAKVIHQMTDQEEQDYHDDYW